MSLGAIAAQPSTPKVRLNVSAYRIPTSEPETDGTAAWDATTMTVVEVDCGGYTGTGWTYGSQAIGALIDRELRSVVETEDVTAVRSIWSKLNGKVRNDGRSGICSYAIAAIDVALWDLRARTLSAPLCDVFGARRQTVPVYGSGGFTSYDVPALRTQLKTWVDTGMFAVKMKVGRDHDADAERVRAARAAIGAEAKLFVDANGGYNIEQAMKMSHRFAESDVSWFEQPVDHRDLEGTARVRDQAPPGMAISSGEYITDTADAPAIAEAVDVLQADATRCGGYTGFLAIDGFCETRRKPLSTHCSPMLHLHVAIASLRLRHMEYFYDHARIEQRLLDGFIEPVGGMLRPDRSRPGHGFAFKHADARKFGQAV